MSNAGEQHTPYDGMTLPPIATLARQDNGYADKGLLMREDVYGMQGDAYPMSRPLGRETGRSMFADNELPHIATLLPLTTPSPETRSAPGMRAGAGAAALPPMRDREAQVRPPDSRDQMQAPGARKRAATMPGKTGTGRLTSSGPKVVACDLCRSRKTKCDGGMPSCSSCARKALPCHYVNDRRHGNGSKRAPRKSSAASKAPTEPSGSPTDTMAPPASADVRGSSGSSASSNALGLSLKRPTDSMDTMRPPKKMKTEVSLLTEAAPIGVP